MPSAASRMPFCHCRTLPKIKPLGPRIDRNIKTIPEGAKDLGKAFERKVPLAGQHLVHGLAGYSGAQRKSAHVSTRLHHISHSLGEIFLVAIAERRAEVLHSELRVIKLFNQVMTEASQTQAPFLYGTRWQASRLS